MDLLKTIITCCCLVLFSLRVEAQISAPDYFVSNDLVYDAELIPTVSFEKFYEKHNQHRRWHFDAGFQVSYSDKFGIIFNNGDVVSIGVYQGPVAKFGYNYYKKWNDRKWNLYISPTLGIKYIYYEPLKVWTDPNWLNSAYRIQSEKCISLVPQFYFGKKRIWSHFCFEYYFGAQLPVKFRDKIIYQEADNYGRQNLNVPYTSYQVIASPDLVFGIKLGYIAYKSIHQQEEERPDAESEDNGK